MEQEKELGGKLIITKKLGLLTKYGNNKGVTSGSENYLMRVGSYEKRYAN